MTLLVRDEEDVVGELLRYHFQQGVDFVVATDHRSVDGTTDILRSYEREGRLHLLREQSETMRQAEWVTRMARLAATDFAADWVINSDADEFWWPRDGPLRDVLESVPRHFGLLHGVWRNFVYRPEDGRPFYERMIVRRRPEPSFESPYHAMAKAVHRGARDVVVTHGNHMAIGNGLVQLGEWLPFDVLHFPIRTSAQMEWKYRRREKLRLPRGRASHVEAALRGFREEGVTDVAAQHLVDDAALELGLADGTLSIDPRLRDNFRDPGRPIAPSTLDDDLALAVELGAAETPRSIVATARRVDGLEQRLTTLERSN